MQVTYLPVKSDGLVDLDLLRDAIRPETALVSIMMVNNEIGELESTNGVTLEWHSCACV
jgi:cysteine desulfurase